MMEVSVVFMMLTTHPIGSPALFMMQFFQMHPHSYPSGLLQWKTST